jgi:5-aminopentanamidase
MKVAAYQAPLLPAGSMAALGLIRQRVDWCESQGVEILCCPEAVLGGLADYAPRPTDFAIAVADGQLDALLAPLASNIVSVILGFTELGDAGRLYNSAAIFHRGRVVGLYRKLYPAIRKSVYEAGDQTPVFNIGGLTLGIIICNDSNYVEPARKMAARGARALFIPTNNGLPPTRADVSPEAGRVDISRATENSMYVIRADVTGRADGLVSYGSSGIVSPEGAMLQSAQRLHEDLIVADINISIREATSGRPTIRLIGPGGAGKSTIGARLAEQLDLVFVDLDGHLTGRVGDISDYIRTHGYGTYARENVEAYRKLMDAEQPPDVVALSSGFMTYSPDIHPEYQRLRREIERSATTFVLLPSVDRDVCVRETVRRQVRRPFGGSARMEEVVIRERFDIYMSVPAQKIETMGNVAAAVDDIVEALRRHRP